MEINNNKIIDSKITNKEINNDIELTQQYIFDLIQSNKLSVGDKLPSERDLAEKLGLSRNAIREALSVLVGMGIIERVQGSGNYIAADVSKTIKNMLPMMLAINETSINEIYEFRHYMESAICKALIERRPSDEWFHKIEKLVQQMQLDLNDVDISIIDHQFHHMLLTGTNNHFWISIIEPVSDIYSLMIQEVFHNLSNEHKKELLLTHKKIYEALKENDLNACLKAIDLHYELVIE